jgi:hypothetical protein
MFSRVGSAVKSSIHPYKETAMTKPNLLSICLLATLMAPLPLVGCQLPPRQDEAQAPDSETKTRDREAQARDSEVKTRDREVQAHVSEAKARDHEVPTRVREVRVRERHQEVGVDFSKGDIAAIRDFYKQGPQLDNPPGQIMKLRQGEAYPFGYTWRSLPRNLENRLSPLPNGYVRIMVGSDIGILNVRTRVVADLLENLPGEAQARDRKALARDRQIKVSKDFSAGDIATIRDFYKQGNQPGLTAGRIMKLRQGEAYPFGYTWRALPSELEARLSPLPQGYIRVIVGTEIGILDVRTRVVADILENPAG